VPSRSLSYTDIVFLNIPFDVASQKTTIREITEE
jgi:hypothetical protein